jgi:hypothetical protein
MKEQPNLILPELNLWFKESPTGSVIITNEPNGFWIKLSFHAKYANGYGATIEESIRCALISWYEAD